MTVETAPEVRVPVRRDRRIAILLAWGPAVVAGAVLLASGRAGAVWQAMLRAQPLPILTLFVVGLALPAVHAGRWRTMLRSVAAEVLLADAVEMTITASLVNYALPGYTGSPAKGLLARQLHRVGFGRSTPTLVAEQVLDAFALGVSALAAVLLTGRATVDRLSAASGSSSAVLLVLIVAFGAAALAVAFVFGARARFRFAGAVVASTRLLVADRSQWRSIALFTGAYWLLGLAAVWTGTSAVGIRLGPAALLWLASVPVLLGMVSPLPGGLGLREAAMAAVGGMLGLPVGAVVAAAVLQRGVLVAALPVALAVTRLARRRGRR